MARNDSVLNTGLSSALDRRIAERKREEQKQKQHAQAKLRPEAELIMAAIDKERDWVRDQIANLPFEVSSDEKKLAQFLLGCQMHLGWTVRFKNQLKAILKVEEDKPDGRT